METGFWDIHPDIIQTELLPRLDGCSLASVSCTSATLRSLSCSRQLWREICKNRWPSTNSGRIQQLISSFPKNGGLSFFSQAAFPAVLAPECHATAANTNSDMQQVLISAVDLFYNGQPVLSKSLETETGSSWFRSAPFRIDLLDAKEVVPTTPIPTPSLDNDDTCAQLYTHLQLSWILIDPKGRRAVNVSSMRPVSVHRHWLTGELQAKFATVLTSDIDIDMEVVCVVEVTWAAVDGYGYRSSYIYGEEETMKVREVGLQVEDVEGTRLCGKQTLQILKRALQDQWVAPAQAQAQTQNRRSQYHQFMEKRRQRKERRKREQVIWDRAYVSMVLFFAALLLRFWTRY